MKAVAKFEKVSFDQFKEGMSDFNFDESRLKEIYDNIKLPHRATAYSAGYDIYTTVDFKLNPGETIKIPTGIRCRMDGDYGLFIFPRSGLGFKFRLQLNNTVGVIDSDYYGSDNEGHIFIKVTNDSNEGKTLTMEQYTGFAQGIFMAYGITEDDDATAVRNGGFGSTTGR